MPINIPVPENVHQAVIAILVFLFVVWLIHRIENRIKSIAQDVAYNNFPFLKKAVESFQDKLDHLNSRVGALEDRTYNLEKDKPKNI